MALSKLSGDEARIVFTQLCNTFKPRDAVAFSSVNRELRASTQAPLQQLKADHEAAAAHLCLKVGVRSCKELREAKAFDWDNKGLSSDDLALLGTLGSVLPALERLVLYGLTAGPDGVQRLAAGLGTGALPAVTFLQIGGFHVGDLGASALAAALGRGALPRLKYLYLINAAIGDAGLVALAPALRRLPALDSLYLSCNPLGDEGLTALVAPPTPTGALPPPTGVLARLKGLDLGEISDCGPVMLTKLKQLSLDGTQVTDAGWAALASAIDGGKLPALETLRLNSILHLPAPPGIAAAYEAFWAQKRSRTGSNAYLAAASRDIVTRATNAVLATARARDDAKEMLEAERTMLARSMALNWDA